jgi:hypothetical protein
MRCDDLKESVDISWGNFKTSHALADDTYSYYGGSDDTHFTVTSTGGGSEEFSKFHISTGSFNAHVWFEAGYPAPDEPWVNDNGFGRNLPGAEYQQFEEWVRENWNEITANAMEFWIKAQGQ